MADTYRYGDATPARRWIADVLAIVPILAFYAWCDQRDVQFWDVGEMQTVPWIFGIAHPTGFPLFTLLGWLFAHVVAIGSVAWRMSFFTSIAMCACGWFVYRVVRDECDAPWIGVGTAYLFDATSIAWSRGTRADVHPLAAAFEAATIYALLRWRASGCPKLFVASAAFFGAALAVHPVALFMVPSMLALALVYPRPRVVRRTLVLACIAILVPLASYLTIPIRSAVLWAHHTDPTLALGLVPGAPFWDYAHTIDLGNFAWFLSGAQFHREAGLTGYTDPRVTVAALAFGGATVWREFGAVPLFVGLPGFFVYAARSRVNALAIVLLVVTVVPFAFAYGEEADKERYLFATLFAIACLIGFGCSQVVSALRGVSRRKNLAPQVVATLLLVGCATWSFYSNIDVIAVDRDATARRYVDSIRALTPRDAIVIAGWSYATPLAYAAYVEHDLDDRIVVASSIEAEANHVAAWSRGRCIAYVAESNAHGFASGSLRSQLRTTVAPFIYMLSNCSPKRH